MSVKKLSLVSATLAAALLLSVPVTAAPSLKFDRLWTYDAGHSPLDRYPGQGVQDFDLAPEAEIVAYDLQSERFFVVNGRARGVDVLNREGRKIGFLDTSDMGSPNSVAAMTGRVAVAVENGVDRQAPGEVWLFSATDSRLQRRITVGALPDMVTFTPDGQRLLVANEGEPSDDYSNDPEGSVSVIDLSRGAVSASVRRIGFEGFSRAAIEASGGRVFGNGGTASVVQDLEPEYIAVSDDGAEAFVTLQENNAVARIDLQTLRVSQIQGLGYKNHGLSGNRLDPSNKDGLNGNLQRWNVLGMYQPDAIATYRVAGRLYYVTANEGDARDYEGYSEEVRVRDLALDLNDNGIADGDADDTDHLGSPSGRTDGRFTLQQKALLGRLKTTRANGDSDGDGLYEQVYAYGARSFSIRDEAGGLIYDSGDLIEQLLAARYPGNWQEDRSDDKGPEPESVVVASLGDRHYALVGLERSGGVMVFDITDPADVRFQDYLVQAGDISPEGLLFVPLTRDKAGLVSSGYLAVANEGSGTTTLYRMALQP